MMKVILTVHNLYSVQRPGMKQTQIDTPEPSKKKWQFRWSTLFSKAQVPSRTKVDSIRNPSFQKKSKELSRSLEKWGTNWGRRCQNNEITISIVRMNLLLEILKPKVLDWFDKRSCSKYDVCLLGRGSSLYFLNYTVAIFSNTKKSKLLRLLP